MIKNISSNDAYFILKNETNSLLLDVRTKEEWENAGVPSIPNKVILLSWQLKPQMKLNNNFLLELQMQNIDKNCELFFLCRSGIRSLAAAEFALSHGYQKCYNIADGFCGSSHGLGWINHNLPWKMNKS